MFGLRYQTSDDSGICSSFFIHRRRCQSDISQLRDIRLSSSKNKFDEYPGTQTQYRAPEKCDRPTKESNSAVRERDEHLKVKANRLEPI